MDYLQVLLVGVVVILTGLLVYIGVQVILILRDVRRILAKVDEVVVEGRESLGSLISPLSNISNLVSTLSSLRGWVKGIVEKRREMRGGRRGGEDREGVGGGGGEPSEQIVPVQKRGREVVRRYFRREGRDLMG